MAWWTLEVISQIVAFIFSISWSRSISPAILWNVFGLKCCESAQLSISRTVCANSGTGPLDDGSPKRLCNNSAALLHVWCSAERSKDLVFMRSWDAPRAAAITANRSSVPRVISSTYASSVRSKDFVVDLSSAVRLLISGLGIWTMGALVQMRSDFGVVIEFPRQDPKVPAWIILPSNVANRWTLILVWWRPVRWLMNGVFAMELLLSL